MRFRLAVLSAVLATGLAPAAAAAQAEAGPPAPAEPGWRSAAVRIEPLPGSAPLTLAGAGVYRGALEVRATGTTGGLAVVNDVALEDYVKGIGEVPASWPAAALEAQAVAARTYALWQRASRSTAPWRLAGADICATQACQVYRGVAAESREGGERWAAAVDRTAGQLLLYEGRLIPAMYSSSNGGGSIDGGVPWLPAVDDPDDLAASPHARWEARFPLERIGAAFPAPGRLIGVSGDGRTVVLRRQLDDGSTTDQEVAGSAFRSAMNKGPAPAGVPVAVPSLRFGAGTEPDGTVVLRGGGFGHLLGMSQYGALGKARRGWTAPQILAAYYGGITPTPFPGERLPATVRVALDLDAARATVDLAGPARVIAADGTILATVAEGRWELRPTSDGAGVLVVPPAGAAEPLAVDVVAVDSGGLVLKLSTPAQVKVGPPGGQPVRTAALGAGEHRVPLALPPEGAPLVVEADAGAGRRLSLAIPAGGGPAVATAPATPAEQAPAVGGVGAQAAADGTATLAAAPLAAAGTERTPLAPAVVAAILLVTVGAAHVRLRRAA